MKNQQDYLGDLAEIRSMMERSSKFLSLSGWAGIMAGIYALVGVYITHTLLKFKPSDHAYDSVSSMPFNLSGLLILAGSILTLAIATAILLSNLKAAKRSEPAWNATSRRMMTNMAMPLMIGGLLSVIFIAKGLIGFLPALTLIFYGLALYTAGHFTFREVRYLGIIEACLGLIAAYFTEHSLLMWALGFGLMNMIYGIYIHSKYER